MAHMLVGWKRKIPRRSISLWTGVLLIFLAAGLAQAQPRNPGGRQPFVVLGISPLRGDSYDRIHTILLEDAAKSRAEDGIISWDLFRPTDGATDLFAVERYRDRATFDRHVEAPYVKVFLDEIPAAVRPGEQQRGIFLRDLLPLAPKTIASPRTTTNIISVLSLRPEMARKAKRMLLAAARRGRMAEGNLVYDVLEEISAPHRLVVFQRWSSAGAYERHRRASDQQALDAVLQTSARSPALQIEASDVAH